MGDRNTANIEILINDIPVSVPKGELIIEAVKRVGLEIPIFCYHPRMKPVGMCRMCIVEVGFKQQDGSIRKMPKPQAACTLPASEGMAIYTDTNVVHTDRKGVLEFLLANHPLDCPICDRGGECPLQNNTIFYGPSSSRFLEFKRHAPKALPLSKYVTLDLERCIQCGRCVRFTEEISGDADLAFRFRGAGMQPSTFQLTDFDSKFSGNVIEICPVGALTSSEYRFKSRPWDLETSPGVCLNCSNGCNIWFDHRGSKVVRINGRTHEGINEEWTCDKGKFGHEFYNSVSRLGQPLVRQGSSLKGSSWADALEATVTAFGDPDVAVGALFSEKLSNEDLYLGLRLVKERLGSRVYQSAVASNVFPSPAVVTRIADYDSRQKIVVFGTSLADDLPILYLRVRKAAIAGANVVNISSKANELDKVAVPVRIDPSKYAALAEALVGRLVSGGKASDSHFSDKDIDILLGELSASTIVTSEAILNIEGGARVVAALNMIAEQTGGEFNCYSLEANGYGAHAIGVRGEMSSKQILQAAASGKLKTLVLAGVDPFESFERDLVKGALEEVENLIVLQSAQNEVTSYATVVLPVTEPAEGGGTFTNMEGRVQKFGSILPARGEAKAPWRVFFDIDVRMRQREATRDWSSFEPLYNSADVMAQLAASNNAFSGYKDGAEFLMPLNKAKTGAAK